jgi:cleavage and polyadenylation specificity factor subunit 1
MENPTFLVVGTGIVDHDGEDVSSRGRILLFDVTKISENTDSVKAELTFVYDKDISIGPVTCLNNLTCENKSRLVVGAGAEITIEQWGNGKLLQVGFFHANMHVQDVVLFKTFFLLSDAYDSLHFLVWRESDKSLTLLAKDYEPTCLYAAGIMSRGGALSFVVQDDRQNLSFYSYSPNEAAARGGNKLVCRADHHIGEQTTGFRNHFCRSSLTVCSATLQSTMVALKQQEPFYGKMDDDQKFGIHYGSSDGSIGCIIPVNEDIYWRLTALQSVMSNALQSDCSLSQRSWRLFRRTVRRGGCRNKSRMKGVIDCDLVVKFADLNNHDQENLASAIGSTVELIMDNLLEVTCSSMIV